MKWFKHYTDSSSCDYIATVEVKYGMAGYGRIYKIKELISSQMTVKESDPKITLPIKKWATSLGFKQKQLKLFFDDLEKENIIKLKQTENHITVIFPKLRESLDNRATSSSSRVSSEDPYENRTENSEEKRLDEKKSVSSSGSFFSKLDRVLKSSEVKSELDRLLIAHFGNEIEPVAKDLAMERIENYFEKQESERSQKLGFYLMGRANKIIDGVLHLKQMPAEIRADYRIVIEVVDSQKKDDVEDSKYISCRDRMKNRTFDKNDFAYVRLVNLLRKNQPVQDWYSKFETILKNRLQH